MIGFYNKNIHSLNLKKIKIKHIQKRNKKGKDKMQNVLVYLCKMLSLTICFA